MRPCSAVVAPRAMFGGLGKMFKGDPAKKTQERLQPFVDQINTLASSMSSKSDDELREITQELKKRATSGTALDELLPEAFAVRPAHLNPRYFLTKTCDLICGWMRLA